MKQTDPKKWIYKTKGRKEYLKTQRLYRQIIGWFVVASIVVIASVHNHFVLEYKKEAEAHIKAMRENVHLVQVVKAVSNSKISNKSEADRIPDTTKTIETDRQKVERIAKVECDKRGLGDFCVQDMLGMAYAESRFNCSVIGDGGKSVGCFQIHRGYHPDVSVEKAKDVHFAIDWTLNRLVKNKYPVMRSVSIMKHNGTPGTVKTKAYLATVNYFVSTLK